MYEVKATKKEEVMCEGCNNHISTVYNRTLLLEKNGKLLQEFCNNYMIIYEVRCNKCKEITHIQVLRDTSNAIL